MKQWIFRLLFGADDMSQHMFTLLKLRKEAFYQHKKNQDKLKEVKELEEDLLQGRISLGNLKDTYDTTRIALEKSYRLELP